jgi:hypothetical protein
VQIFLFFPFLDSLSGGQDHGMMSELEAGSEWSIEV